jgi:putative membrane protein insertion efficiency factor
MKKVKEHRNTCNVCGTVWHYTAADVREETCRYCRTCSCLGPQMKEFDRCPECKSKNVKTKYVEYEVKSVSIETLEARGLAERVILALLRAYKAIISPILRRHVRCRFYPTCSSYAMISVGKYGWLKGSAKAVQRLGRCKPRNYDTCIDFP